MYIFTAPQNWKRLTVYRATPLIIYVLIGIVHCNEVTLRFSAIAAWPKKFIFCAKLITPDDVLGKGITLGIHDNTKGGLPARLPHTILHSQSRPERYSIGNAYHYNQEAEPHQP